MTPRKRNIFFFFKEFLLFFFPTATFSVAYQKCYIPLSKINWWFIISVTEGEATRDFIWLPNLEYYLTGWVTAAFCSSLSHNTSTGVRMLYEKLSSAGCSFQHSFFSQEVQNVIFKSKHRQDARNEPFLFPGLLKAESNHSFYWKWLMLSIHPLRIF